MSGGGGGGPSQTTNVNTNIPEYARPYVENMLEAGQRQLFQTQDGEITGFRPYSPYSTDPTKYFAGPSGLQQSAYGAAGQLQSPTQYQTGTQLATAGGMGQLGTAQQAGMYGAQGAGLGRLGMMGAMPAFGAGQQYASQVTNPAAVQSYMSPYQQAVTDVAKNAAVREAQIANQAANLASARQGTYGGARQALAQAERERGLLSNLSNIQAQGAQSAYDRAIQSQQFGANLGLQGIQTGLQGVQAGMQGIGQGLQGVGAQQAGYAGAGQAGATLGQLGSAQQAADINAINLQNQLGQQQQQYQQNIINQAIQDYATAQQYPYMQLSTMSNLLRGLPMQGMSTQQYQAQPSTTQQLLGLAGTGASLYGAFKREGGAIKEYAAGGAIGDMRSRLEDMADTDPKGLARLVAQSNSKEVKKIGNEILAGIARADVGDLGRNMAGGGIIAFEDGGYVDPMGNVAYNESSYGIGDMLHGIGTYGRSLMGLPEYVDFQEQEREKKRKELASKGKGSGETESDYQAFDAATAQFEKDRAAKNLAGATGGKGATGGTGAGRGQSLTDILAERKKLLGVEGPGAKSEALMKALEERQAGLAKEAESDRYLRAAEAFAKFGSTAGPMLKGASEALGGFAKGESAARREQDKIKMEGMKMQSDLEKAQRAEARGDLDAAEKFYSSAEDRRNRIEVAQIGAAATGQTARFEKEAIERVMAENPGMRFEQALAVVRGAGRQESVELQKQKAVLASLDAQIMLAKKEDKPALIKRREEIYSQMVSNPTGGSGKVIDFNAIK